MGVSIHSQGGGLSNFYSVLRISHHPYTRLRTSTHPSYPCYSVSEEDAITTVAVYDTVFPLGDPVLAEPPTDFNSFAVPKKDLKVFFNHFLWSSGEASINSFAWETAL